MTGALTLFEIEDDLQALVDSEGLVTPEQEQEYRLQLAAQLKSAVDKRQCMGEFIRYCELMQNNCNAEIARIEKLRDSFATAERRAKDYVVFTIESAGPDEKGRYPKLTGRTLTLSVQRNPSSVDVQDERLVPDEYRNVNVKLRFEIWERVLNAFEKDSTADKAVLQELQLADGRCSIDLDKTAIKNAIRDGKEVPGADLAIGKLRCKVS